MDGRTAKVLAGAILWAGCAQAQAPTAAPPQSTARPVIARAADLPPAVFSTTLPPSRIAADPVAAADLAKRLDADAATLLDTYDIRDRATSQGLLATRAAAALLLRRDREAAAFVDRMVALQPKPAQKATTALDVTGLAAVSAAPAGADPAKAYAAAVTARLDSQPADLVRPRVLEARRTWLLASPAYAVGRLAASADAGWAKSHTLSRDLAGWTLESAVNVQRSFAMRSAMLAALDGWTAAHPPPPTAPEIWSARDIVLPAGKRLAPVTIAIWDVGVDPAVYPGRFSVAPDKVLAFDAALERTTGPLAPVPPELAAQMPQLERDFQGSLDLVFGVDSAEGRALADRIVKLKPGEVKAYDEGRSFFRGRVHGTFVAGVAIRGNPAARILPIRRTPSRAATPPPWDEAYATRFAAVCKASIAEMQAHHARLANLSWGFTAKTVEALLERNGLEPDPGARKARAARIFDTMFDGMQGAMASAPEILFVVAAGNSDEDIDFTKDLPSSIPLPNVLAVGAADQAGAATSFTSMGKTVKLYASGYRVESAIPGGRKVVWSGSSISAPQVVNAAGKLLALDPTLTTAQLVDVLARGATPVDGAPRLPLLNARASQALLGRR